MREVAIIGIGQTIIAEQWEKSLRELAGEALLAALADAGRERVDGIFVGNMLSGPLNHQENLGVLVADWVGLRGSKVSNAFLLFPGDLTNRSRIDAFGLFTGQIGYAWGDTLFYVKGGLAVTTARYNDIVTATGLIAATASDTRAGGAVGAGLEYGFFPGWSVAVEYDHLFMGSRNLAFSSLGIIPGLPPASSTVVIDRIRQDLDLVTVRVNYTFGGPAIAKY